MLGLESLIYVILVGGMGGWSGGIGLRLVSEMSQFDLGGSFIHEDDNGGGGEYVDDEYVGVPD